MVCIAKIAARVLLGVVIAVSACVSASGAVVGPEVMLDPNFGAASGVQDSVAIAAGPNGYFAVWQDNRGTNGMDIFGARISPNGEVLDTMSIPVCTMQGDQVTPAVTWDGQRYLVVWQDRRDAGYHIYGCRVSATAEVLDPQGILLSGTVGNQSYPRAAGDGAGALVVWQDQRSASPDIYCCKVTTDGLPGRIYGVTTRFDNEEMPDVAFNGSVFFVAWRDYRNSSSSDTDIYGVRVSRTGIRSGMDVLVSCTSSSTVGAPGAQRCPRICSAGTNWFIVWEDLRDGSVEPDVYGTRLSSTAVVLDRGGVRIAATDEKQERPAVGFNGSKLLVTWRNGVDRKVCGARLTTSAAMIDTSPIQVSSGAAGSSGCAVAGVGGSYVVSWSSLSAIASDCIFTHVSDSGVASVPSGSVASLSLISQRDYCVVDSGNECAVVWSEVVGGSERILGARVSHDGVILTPEPVILTDGFPGHQMHPSIAWNGTKYLLVWCGSETFATSDLDIRGCFLEADLTPVGTASINICVSSYDQLRPTAASNGSNFLVAWQDMRNAVSPYYYSDVYAATVSAVGAVKNTSGTLCLAANNQFAPRAASDGSGYLVVWEDYRNGTPVIVGARVNANAQVLDSGGISFPSTSSNQTAPAVCYGNGSYFVTWSDYSKITACRVTSSGTLLDPAGIIVDSGTRRKQSPGVCWDGQKYYVVWEDYRSSTYDNSDVYCTTVDSNGVVSSAPETALASDLLPQVRPSALVHQGIGLLFYSTLCNYSDSLRFVTLTDAETAEIGCVAEAKWMAVGTPIKLRSKVVSAVFPGFFYIQETDRSSGIRVVSTETPLVGDLVDVTGTVSVVDGERQINASAVTGTGVADYGVLQPLGIRGDCLGGAALNAHTPGITGAVGLHNIGLLATTWGKVTYSAGNYFIIEVKPAVYVKVKSGTLQRPSVGKSVAVTGVSSCEIVAGASTRAILPRVQEDIRILY